MKVKTTVRTVDGEKFENVQNAEGAKREKLENILEKYMKNFQHSLMVDQNNFFTIQTESGTAVFNLNHIVSVHTEIIED